MIKEGQKSENKKRRRKLEANVNHSKRWMSYQEQVSWVKKEDSNRSKKTKSKSKSCSGKLTTTHGILLKDTFVEGCSRDGT